MYVNKDTHLVRLNVYSNFSSQTMKLGKALVQLKLGQMAIALGVVVYAKFIGLGQVKFIETLQ